tara:strand:+ start:981 stop:1730 length:750 start_codon:yes stop_codon:yes gene_type:complete
VNQTRYIQDSIASFTQCVWENDRVVVPTLNLYPSNSTVTVYVTGGGREVVVTDDGGAIDEILAHGLPVEDGKNLLRTYCKTNGLNNDGRKIFTAPIPIAAVTSAIALVANASSLAAFGALSKIKIKQRRDLGEALQLVLQQRFTKNQIRHEVPIPGESTKQYKFDTVIELGSDQKLILDTVVPESTAVNARIVSHMDVAHRKDIKIHQRIVYDQSDEWRSSDLKLLEMASTLVPFEMVTTNLDRLIRNR